MDTASTHKMSITALVDVPLPVAQTSQQQQQQPTPLPLAACGSISPVTAGTKVKRKRKRVVGPKRPRKSRVIYNFTLETLEQYFHLSQRDAAKLLGVAPITMKRNCKRQGILWPYRAKKIEAAHRARKQQEADLPSEAESTADDNDNDNDDESEDGNSSSASDCSAQQAGKELSGHTTMSEAARLFARLPFLCLANEHVESPALE